MAATDIKKTLIEKITNKKATVGVVGLGYVGLPFAVEKAKVGFQVLGIDRSVERVAMVNRGENYITDVDDAEFKKLVDQGLIKAVDNFSVVPELDVIVIAVPTPLTKQLTPELKYVEAVSSEIAKYLRPGQLISLESTTYPGTTEEIMLPILAASNSASFAGNKAEVEKDFFLAHSPERVDPGNTRYSTKNTNKVVGGVGPESLEVSVAFYSQTIDHVVPVSSAKAAELTKVFENTFRAVNIALVNEITLLCDRMNLDVWEVLDAAFTKPFGIMPFYPGPGVGGHCIPLDPHYLEWKSKELNFTTHFIALAGETNRKMPEFVVDKTIRLLNQLGKAVSQSKIMILGMSYKKNLGDWRESPSIVITKLLNELGASVCYHDPYVPSVQDGDTDLSSVPFTKENIKAMDLVLLATDHDDVDYNLLVDSALHVFDTRNKLKSFNTDQEKVTRL